MLADDVGGSCYTEIQKEPRNQMEADSFSWRISLYCAFREGGQSRYKGSAPYAAATFLFFLSFRDR